jgi:hypothetical protein
VKLQDKIVRLHTALDAAGLPHAFGGALALGWCTHQARGTIDIDINVFLDVARVPELLAALPRSVAVTDSDRAALERDGQTRLFWDETPVDVFLNTTEFHEAAAARVVTESFYGATVPFLGCSDLAVFKTFLNRTKDWADVEEMLAAGTIDTDRVLGTLVRYLGPDDDRVARLRNLIV